ncbi:MAG: hypothetical protein GYB65_13220 [Chloroflexi bacterium]|nr:hypothetical protein [Chloroflexota bacterium]
MSNSQKKLERAFKLIKSDKTDEALKILHPIVQAEPTNPHAWWLLAYAEDEPARVREALNKVLTLDPSYPNAPKAREMLARLNEEYPPEPDEMSAFSEMPTDFDTFGTEADTFMGLDAEPAFGEDVDPFDEAGFDAAFGEPAYTPDDPFGAADDPFGVTDDPFGATDDPFAAEQTFGAMDDDSFGFSDDPFGSPSDSSDITFDVDTDAGAPSPAAIGLPEFDLDTTGLEEEDIAALEEQVGRRQNRGRRILFMLVTLLLVSGAASFLILGLSGGEKGETDPGPVKAVAVNMDFQPFEFAFETPSGTPSQTTGEGTLVVADVEEQNVLVVELCGSPNPDLAPLVRQGMYQALKQAPTVQAGLEDVTLGGVGVAVNDCNAEGEDTLYRAYVTRDNAAAYLRNMPAAPESAAQDEDLPADEGDSADTEAADEPSEDEVEPGVAPMEGPPQPELQWAEIQWAEFEANWQTF